MLTLLQPRALNLAFADAGLTLDTGATTYDTANTLTYCIDGKWQTAKTAVTNGATPTTDINTGAAFTSVAANQGCVLVFSINAAGDINLAQGPVTGLDAEGAFEAPDAPQFPHVSDVDVPFAYVLIKNGATGSAWIPGTSNWDATGITSTVVNVATLPARPQLS